MNQFKLSAKFYIVFSLVLAIPAFYLANSLQSFLSTLSIDNILRRLANIGIIEAPTAVTLLFIAFTVVDNWLWRVKGVVSFLDIPYDINGRYEGSLISSYDKNKVYDVIIEVKQSLTNIEIWLYTENSSSYSIVATIGKNNQGNFDVSYLYQNTTHTVNHDEDMKDHRGVAFLEMLSEGSRLKGYYFNNPRDRGRHGDIEVHRIERKLKKSFN